MVGGRVQNLLMPGLLSLSLEIYRSGTGRAHLLMSAHPQHARVHLTATAPTRDPEQRPPLLLLLRKYVRGGTLVDASQPLYERVLVLSIAKRIAPDKHQEYHFEGDFRLRDGVRRSNSDDKIDGIGQPGGDFEGGDDPEEDLDAPVNVVRLYVEVMGRLSNIVLVGEDGLILDSIKRVPPSINRYRLTLPKHEYVPPPPQEKRDPLHTSINTLALELSRASEEGAASVWKGLVAGFLGVSPTLAREVAFRALGSVEVTIEDMVTHPQHLSRVLAQLQAFAGGKQPGEKSTVAWRATEGEEKPLDFAPYALTHLAGSAVRLAEHESISEAISSYYASIETVGGHSALRGQVRAEIKEQLGREERKLAALRQQLSESEALEELRRKGEMVLAYMHTLQPGQRRLEIPEEGLSIELDPGLTPVESAQELFKEYRKAKSAHEGLPELVQAAELSVEYWDSLLTSLEIAATYDDVRAVQTEARAARSGGGPTRGDEAKGRQPTRRGKPQEKTPQPLRTQTKRGAQVLVGRTAGQNDTATFRLAAPEDLWLHARGVPGAHVILRTSGGVSEADIVEAAALAAGYSKLRNEAQVDVLCAERRYVRRIPNAPPGSATYKNERVIRVAPTRREG